MKKYALKNNVHYHFAEYFDKNELKPYLYLLSKKMAEGNVCLDIEAAEKYLIEEQEDEDAEHIAKVALDQNALKHDLVGKNGEIKPFILHDNKLYIQRYFNYETQFIEGIKTLIKNDDVENKTALLLNDKALKQAVKKLFPANDNSNRTDWQLAACLTSYLHQFSIITGGPGTGKTTTVAKLLALLMKEQHLQDGQQLNVKLCAPTGKAAARMNESLQQTTIHADENIVANIKQLTATTIHSLLGLAYDPVRPKQNKQNPIDADVVIVDECSMIDIALFSKLIVAIEPTKTKLILMGDRNQLASVDAGSLFGDLCLSLEELNTFDKKRVEFINQFAATENAKIESTHITESVSHPLFQHIVELQFSHRSNENILAFSNAVLAGDTQKVAAHFINKDDEIILCQDNSTVLKKDHEEWWSFFAKKLLKGYVLEKDIAKALQQTSSSKILCAIKSGKDGVHQINERISQLIRKNTEEEFYENRLLMVVKNQSSLGIFNGDIGLIRKDESNIIKVYFPKPDAPLQLLPGDIEACEDAYAMTIHKSQGSEFGEVLIIIPKSKKTNFMTRELLYTAVTRAKNTAVIIGDKETILNIVQQSVSRASGIKNRWHYD